MEKEQKPISFITYRQDRDDPRKQKAVLTPQARWEDDWLTWWYRRGSVQGSSRR